MFQIKSVIIDDEKFVEITNVKVDRSGRYYAIKCSNEDTWIYLNDIFTPTRLAEIQSAIEQAHQDWILNGGKTKYIIIERKLLQPVMH